MQIEVRPVRRLRDTPAARAAFGPLISAVAASDADLTRLRVVCDWIQYRNNFRDTVMVRPVLPATGPVLPATDGAPEAHELAVDLRRVA
ncbi:MAG: hypothetical protein J2P25_19605, partial [Nocardiopsaceae bacterium]|nr:hypothetical protein [Nocardiopsaceae bacterium]